MNQKGKVPVRAEVNAACEMLGLDPFYIANECKLVAVIPGGRQTRSWRRCVRIRVERMQRALGLLLRIIPAWSWRRRALAGQE